MKQVLISIILLLILTANSNSRDFYFKYDKAGNREARSTIPFSKKPATEEQEKQEPIKDAILIHDISIYPNPTKGELKIDITNLSDETSARIEIFDLQGKPVLQLSTNENSNILDLSKQPSGVYFLKIFIGEKSTVWKIVKEE